MTTGILAAMALLMGAKADVAPALRGDSLTSVWFTTSLDRDELGYDSGLEGQSVPLSGTVSPSDLTAARWQSLSLDSARIPGRPRAIQYSDWYYRRLVVHRIASFAEYPLFVAEYLVGSKLLSDYQRGTPPKSLRSAHSTIAGGIAALFALNTITGAWNLWESRKDPAGRTRRWVHSILLLASDAGFVATGSTGKASRRSTSNANFHRGLAVGSMGVSLGATVMMWFWR